MAKIFSLSEASSIAIHSMVLILTNNETINAITIAEKVGASRHHAAKVLQRLVKDGLLSSNRGPSGGFVIKKSPKEVTFYDIYKSIEGDIEIPECSCENKICTDGNCLFEEFGRRVTLEFKEYMKNTTLQSYYDQKHKNLIQAGNSFIKKNETSDS